MLTRGSAVSTEQPAPNNPYVPPRAAPDGAMDSTKVMRILGVLLLANGIQAIVERLVIFGLGRVLSMLAAPLTDLAVLLALVDVTVGLVLLVSGEKSLRTFVVVRIVAGVLVLGWAGLQRGSWGSFGVGVPYAALLLLIVGRPGVGRVAAGAGVFSLYLVLRIVGLVNALAVGTKFPG
jgi:hypothetical protein